MGWKPTSARGGLQLRAWPGHVRVHCKRLLLPRHSRKRRPRPKPKRPVRGSKPPSCGNVCRNCALDPEIEARVRGKSAADSLVRQARATAGHGTARLVRGACGRGPTADAIRYALNHWDGLGRFLEDGRIELDMVGAMRPVCLSRKTAFLPAATLARHTAHLAMSL